MSEIKLTLIAARVNAGFGATEAARLLGICRTTLWQYEHGKREPKWDMVRKMCELYRCPIDCLTY